MQFGCVRNDSPGEKVSGARLHPNRGLPVCLFNNILVPVNFSPATPAAVKRAIGLARLCGGSVTLLYVMDLNLHTPLVGPANADKLKDRLARDGQELLLNTINDFKDEGVKICALITEGLPHQEISEAARHSDLIVIGKNRRSSFWNLFSRRTVEAVLDEATCPVLVVQCRTDASESEAVAGE